MKANARNIVFLLLLVAVFIFAAVIISDMIGKEEEFGYSDVVELIEKDQIKTFSIDVEGYMTLETVDGQEYVFRLGYTPQIEYIHQWATEGEHPNLKSYNFEEPVDKPWILEFLPYIILLLLLNVFSALYTGITWFFCIFRYNPSSSSSLCPGNSIFITENSYTACR